MQIIYPTLWMCTWTTGFHSLSPSGITRCFKEKSGSRCTKSLMAHSFGCHWFLKSCRVDMLEVLEDIPSGLTKVYDRMMKHIQQLQRRYSRRCLLALSEATLAYQPLHLREIHIIAGLQEEVQNLEDLERITNMCGSFLSIRDNYVYFIHQSAKDYLTTNASALIFRISCRAWTSPLEHVFMVVRCSFKNPATRYVQPPRSWANGEGCTGSRSIGLFKIFLHVLGRSSMRSR